MAKIFQHCCSISSLIMYIILALESINSISEENSTYQSHWNYNTDPTLKVPHKEMIGVLFFFICMCIPYSSTWSSLRTLSAKIESTNIPWDQGSNPSLPNMHQIKPAFVSRNTYSHYPSCQAVPLMQFFLSSSVIQNLIPESTSYYQQMKLNCIMRDPIKWRMQYNKHQINNKIHFTIYSRENNRNQEKRWSI